ncbi:MAG: hypothetical protein QOJ59_2246, partial [Thermomicrobiales bacterium]|nr:hypothetical protein [Thermomicrobiales bacterium]
MRRTLFRLLFMLVAGVLVVPAI